MQQACTCGPSATLAQLFSRAWCAVSSAVCPHAPWALPTTRPSSCSPNTAQARPSIRTSHTRHTQHARRSSATICMCLELHGKTRSTHEQVHCLGHARTHFGSTSVYYTYTTTPRLASWNQDATRLSAAQRRLPPTLGRGTPQVERPHRESRPRPIIGASSHYGDWHTTTSLTGGTLSSAPAQRPKSKSSNRIMQD